MFAEYNKSRMHCFQWGSMLSNIMFPGTQMSFCSYKPIRNKNEILKVSFSRALSSKVDSLSLVSHTWGPNTRLTWQWTWELERFNIALFVTWILLMVSNRKKKYFNMKLQLLLTLSAVTWFEYPGFVEVAWLSSSVEIWIRERRVDIGQHCLTWLK